MKKVKTILIIILMIILSLILYKISSNLKSNEQRIKNATVQELTKKKEIQKVNNAKIVRTELNKVGKLLVLQGKENYKDNYKDAAEWLGIEWASKEIYLDLTYSFALSYDLKNLSIYTVGDSVHITVNPEKFYIEYVELNNKESVMSSYASLFAEKVTAEEISAHLELAQERTLQDIQENEKYFELACDSLDEQLRNIIEPLGFKNILIDFGGEENE